MPLNLKRGVKNNAPSSISEYDTEYECEFRMLKGDGEIRWVIGKGSVFYDVNGAPARLLGVELILRNAN